MSFYHDILNPGLALQLQDHLNKLLPEQFSLAEEVGLHRILCADAVKDWSDARELARHAETEKAKLMAADLIQICGDKMAAAFQRHASLASSAANTDGRMREILTASTLMHYMRSVVTLVNERYNDGSPEGIVDMQSFEEELLERITVQEANTDQLTVESQFGAMIATIPKPAEQQTNE